MSSVTSLLRKILFCLYAKACNFAPWIYTLKPYFRQSLSLKVVAKRTCFATTTPFLFCTGNMCGDYTILSSAVWVPVLSDTCLDVFIDVLSAHDWAVNLPCHALYRTVLHFLYWCSIYQTAHHSGTTSAYGTALQPCFVLATIQHDISLKNSEDSAHWNPFSFCPNLTLSQKSDVQALLLKFLRCLALSQSELGCTASTRANRFWWAGRPPPIDAVGAQNEGNPCHYFTLVIVLNIFTFWFASPCSNDTPWRLQFPRNNLV